MSKRHGACQFSARGMGIEVAWLDNQRMQNIRAGDDPSAAWLEAKVILSGRDTACYCMLLLVASFGAAEINELGFLLASQLHYIGDGLGHQLFPVNFAIFQSGARTSLVR